MPAPRDWTQAEVETIRTLRADNAGWEEIARRIGVARWTVIEFAKRVGLWTPPAVAVEVSDEPDRYREPSRAGHPLTWGAIVAGTCLAGEEYRG